jgi:hypothetical protein
MKMAQENPSYDFEKLSREIVLSRLKAPDAGPGEFSVIAKKTMLAALASTHFKQDPRLTVRSICRGLVGGVFLSDANVADAASQLLSVLSEVGQEASIAPSDLMTWAMEGIAEIARMAPPGTQTAIADKIESTFHGAGPIFRQFCQ